MNKLVYLFSALLLVSVLSCSKKAPDFDLEAFKKYVDTLETDLAIDTLTRLLREKSEDPIAPSLAYVMAEAFKDEESAISMYQAMSLAYPKHPVLEKTAVRIPEGAPSLADRIAKFQAQVFDPTSLRMNLTAYKRYMHACIAHALLLPNDKQSQDLLYKAADNAYYTQHYERALYLHEWFTSAYPDNEKAAQSLFMQAFITDNDLKDYTRASVLYQLFIERYPNDDFADDAQFLLDNLGKTPEEVIRAGKDANTVQ
jgi:tetratricopeptide (TPR) repeat protein